MGRAGGVLSEVINVSLSLVETLVLAAPIAVEALSRIIRLLLEWSFYVPAIVRIVPDSHRCCDSYRSTTVWAAHGVSPYY